MFFFKINFQKILPTPQRPPKPALKPPSIPFSPLRGGKGLFGLPMLKGRLFPALQPRQGTRMAVPAYAPASQAAEADPLLNHAGETSCNNPQIPVSLQPHFILGLPALLCPLLPLHVGGGAVCLYMLGMPRKRREKRCPLYRVETEMCTRGVHTVDSAKF